MVPSIVPPFISTDPITVFPVNVTSPPDEILMASGSLTEPISPPSWINMSVLNLEVVLVINNLSLLFIFILTPVLAWIFINPSVSELIWISESLNCNCIASFNNNAVSGIWVNFTSLFVPKFNIASSDNKLTSFPNIASFVTDKPPSVCNEPSVVDVASVALSIIILPSAVIWPVEVTVTPVEPAPPAISKSPLSSTLKTSVSSNCLNTKSSLFTISFIITSPTVPSKSNDSWFVPPSWKLISPVVELKSRLPVESIDIGVAAIVKPVVPSWVNVASLPRPKFNIAPSDNKLTSFPNIASFVTDKPPSVCNEPSVVDVASVALSIIILPSAVIWPVEVTVTPVEPAPPAISKSPLSSTLKTSVSSNCLNTKSSLFTISFIITSPTVPSKSNDSWFVPPSWKLISPVVELKSRLPVESIDIGVAAIVKPVVPSWVNVASLPRPKFNIAPSDNKLTSFPTYKSWAIPTPPPTVKAPVVVDVDAVVDEILTTPVDEILMASVSLVEPIVPVSGITMLVPNVDVVLSITNSSIPLTLILTLVNPFIFRIPPEFIVKSVSSLCI